MAVRGFGVVALELAGADDSAASLEPVSAGSRVIAPIAIG